MSELFQLQDQFQNFLLSGNGTIHDSIIGTGLVSVDTRLGIYRDAYRIRLIESLSTNFPALYAYLGTEEFNKLALYYIEAHPSNYRSIRWFGDLLSDFIKLNYPQYPHLAELAEFEWKMSLAFDAVDEPVVQVEEMAAILPESWPNLQFVLHPSLQRVNFLCNTVPLWRALTHDHELPQLEQNAISTSCVIWRTPEYITQFYSMSQEEAWALDNLSNSVSFGIICEGLCQWINPEEVGMKAASLLKGWIQNGMISQILIDN
ncbi:Uncharacterized protein conserved in bacteria [Legionella wadsworthii]|uniref:Uncharacterized protein conserved in bacteria n=1 Tax=Legionella wadsworthii TaxID=28088 RepID=A0A378LNN9_9GAMM|nr:putative DNA-binding domain-containing protein [Legionella wadsworthii]STY28595.1 Uncharacterized protein conserved in bacteria [Legionella wadsworthii]